MLRTSQASVCRRLARLRYSVRDIAAVMKYDERDVREALRVPGWRERQREQKRQYKVRRFTESLQAAADRRRAEFYGTPVPAPAAPPVVSSPAPDGAGSFGSGGDTPRGNRCPLCGAYSFDGETCRPVCDPGNLRRAGIELVPIVDCHSLGEIEQQHRSKRTTRDVRFRDTKEEREQNH